jgi:hypothetical protein
MRVEGGAVHEGGGRGQCMRVEGGAVHEGGGGSA